MNFKLLERTSPFAERAANLALNVSGSEDRYGAHSIQIFPSMGAAGNLHATHADAQGFMEWYGTWNPGNFWFRDDGVKVWAYEETYDNWQDSYGMDSVVAFYHSGHGGMDGNGLFFAPMGGTWDGRIDAFSSNMVIGNEQLRYLFWSTCQSLKVPEILDVNPNRITPMKTWDAANRGLRMIFGYQSNSVDNPNYGKNFGNNWNAGQKFSEAWINSSWAISHNQIPTVCAMGANVQESQNRLFNERSFEWGAVAKNWYSWRWGGFERPVFQAADRQELPKKPEVLLFGKPVFDEKRLAALGKELGFAKNDLETFGFERNGTIVASGAERKLTVDAEGRLLAVLGDANYENTKTIQPDKAIKAAEKSLKDLRFEQDGIELVFDSLRVDRAQSGTLQGSGKIEDAFVTDTTVIFRQAHKGVKSINNNHGLVMMTYDNDGKLTRIHNSTKQILGVTNKPKRVVPDPVKGSKSLKFELQDGISLNNAVRSELGRVTGIEFASSRNGSPLKSEIIEALDGYDFSGQTGELTAQREYSVDHGEANGESIQKAHIVRVPLFS